MHWPTYSFMYVCRYITFGWSNILHTQSKHTFTFEGNFIFGTIINSNSRKVLGTELELRFSTYKTLARRGSVARYVSHIRLQAVVVQAVERLLCS
jgi:hypothetical protein